MKTILASVYAVNPYKGSEDGTGWNLLLQIARYNRVIAITRLNNRPEIERFLKQADCPLAANVRFLYYDLPYWMRFWKKGPRGALLYYYLWQAGLPGFVRRSGVTFDITHNLNFHSDCAPSFLWRLGKPFVWGPVGHHPRIPAPFIRGIYGNKAWLADSLRWFTKRMIWTADPFLHRSKQKAARILAINTEVNKCLKADPAKLFIMPAVASNDMRTSVRYRGAFRLITVGRFVALKGFDVALRSFARFLGGIPVDDRKEIRLVLVGSGPERKFIDAIIDSTGLKENVEIIEWVDRVEMSKLYSAAHLFLFPSHEGAGMVVPEALSCGLPVVCFDNAGPGEFVDASCALRIPYASYGSCVMQFAAAIDRLYRSPELLRTLSEGARIRYESAFRWDSKGDTFKSIYEKIG